MENYSHSDVSLVTIFERLKTLNLEQEHILSVHSAEQMNQISNLKQLGMVYPAPQVAGADIASLTGSTKSAAQPSLLECISIELNKMEASHRLMNAQVDAARFIGEVLYKQTPASLTSVPEN